MSEFEKQQLRIDSMYKRLGNTCLSPDGVTVGFGRNKKYDEALKNRVIEKSESEFFKFNNALNNFL